MTIRLPHNYTARPYQENIWRAMRDGAKRACCVWHRRSGKDKTFLNIMTIRAHKRIGAYYYFFPTYQQGRRILWDGMDREGFKFLNHIPESLREKTNSTEMKVTLKCGSIIQVVGTDNYDSIMGTNPLGCVFSEYSLQDPGAWDYIRPILVENEGWALFNYTPRGRNHGFELFEMARKNPEWFCELLTVDDTHSIPLSAIDSERQAGMEEAVVQQEFWCSFDAALQSCFFADTLARHKECNPGSLGYLDGDAAWHEDRVGTTEIWDFPYYRQDDFNGRRWKHRYAIGSDVAEGLGGDHDFSVAYVYDRLTDRFVARMRSNRIDAHLWGDHLNRLSTFYDRAIICPERTGAGISTVFRLLELNGNLYFKTKPAVAGKDITKVYGWPNQSTADAYYLAGNLKAYFANTASNIPDAKLLDEAASYIKTEGGKLDHDDGFKSDCVVAAGCALEGSLFLPGPPELMPLSAPVRRPPADMSEVAALERQQIEKEFMDQFQATEDGIREVLDSWRDE